MSVESWRLSLPCTRAEAEAIDIDQGAVALIDPAPALMTSEEVTDDAERWRLDVFFEGKPDAAAIAAVRALVPSAAAIKTRAARVPEDDWVKLSQSGLEPVVAGRFFVHTGDAPPPPGVRAFAIPAGRAFGTGHHETTTGCLTMLDAIRRGGTRVDNLIDLGTGTGLLAFAALHLWPRAYATATDIDEVAVAVAVENANRNGVPLGTRRGRVALAIADGTDNALVQWRAPYDLVIANILAPPLIAIAADVAAITAPGGQVVLAGLLQRQASDVAAAYRRAGFRLAGRLDLGDWAILRLRKRAQVSGKNAPAREGSQGSSSGGITLRAPRQHRVRG